MTVSMPGPAEGGSPAGDSRRGHLVLVLGGARSGKSDFARNLARAAGGDRVLFVATAQGFHAAVDPEMAERIERHRRSRPAAWRTVEVQGGRLVEQLEAEWRGDVVLLLDCVSLLVSQFLPVDSPSPQGPPSSVTQAPGGPRPPASSESPGTPELAAAAELRATPQPQGSPDELWERVRRELEGLEALVRRRGATAILVSNETGWGVVPPYPSGRLFRDVLGWANQFLAACADEVWLLVAGLPLCLKPGLAYGSGASTGGSGTTRSGG